MFTLSIIPHWPRPFMLQIPPAPWPQEPITRPSFAPGWCPAWAYSRKGGIEAWLAEGENIGKWWTKTIIGLHHFGYLGYRVCVFIYLFTIRPYYDFVSIWSICVWSTWSLWSIWFIIYLIDLIWSIHLSIVGGRWKIRGTLVYTIRFLLWDTPSGNHTWLAGNCKWRPSSHAISD